VGIDAFSSLAGGFAGGVAEAPPAMGRGGSDGERSAGNMPGSGGHGKM